MKAMSLACLRAAPVDAGVQVGAEHGVGLPELVGVFHAEGEAFFVVVVVGSEQVVLANEAVEGGLGDAAGWQQALLDAEAIQGPLVGARGCGSGAWRRSRLRAVPRA